MFSKFALTRRSYLGLLGSAGLTSAGLGQDKAASAANLADPAVKLDAYVRLRTRIDGKPSFIQYQGTIYGKPEGEKAVPLFGVIGASWLKAVRIDPLHYEFRSTEAGYFTDLISNAVLDSWVNPLNGLQTTVKHYLSSQTQIVSADKIERKMDKPPPEGFDYNGAAPPAIVIGPQLWMKETLIVRMPSRPKESFSDPREYFGPFTTATSLATLTAPLAEILDRKRSFVSSTLAYQTLGSWRPFMLMGSTPGLISWQMAGLKFERFEQVDKSLRDRILADHPDFFKDL